jgi:TP901 family phage tail tape measure protein
MGAGAIADLFVLLNAKDMGLIAKFGEGGAAGERMAVQVAAAMAEVEASVAKVAESTRMVVTAGNEMAVSWERDIAAMRAETAALAEGMAAAEVKATASMAELDAATAAQSKRFSMLGEASGISNKALMGVGVVAAGAGIEFAKMAGDFNMATTRLVTSAGETNSNLQMVRDGILAMAGSVGYSSEELAAAMYKVESGGQHGAAGLKVLQAAAEGAKAENASLTTVSDALTSAMVDYKVPADQAATVTSKLVAATSQGKMTFEELAGSMAAILPVASANHVALNDVLGDLASMTVHGMSAQQASQNLADAIRHMAAPTQVQAKELASLGMNATEVSKSLGEKGLSGTINTISDRIRSQMGPDGMVVLNLTNALKGMTPEVQKLGMEVLNGTTTLGAFSKEAGGLDVISGKQAKSFAALAGTMHGIGTEAKSGAEVYQTYAGAMQKAMGDATGMNVALMIGGENAGVTANAIKVVSGATADASGHVKGFAEIQQEFNFKLAAAKDGLGALAISIGEKLLPVLTPLVGMLATGATWLANHQAAATVLAFVIGGALVVGLVAATVATWTWFSALAATNLALIGIEAPLWIVIGVVAALGFAVYEVIQHWQGIANFFKGLWHDVVAVFEGAKDLVMAPIHAIAKAWDAFVGGFQNPAAKLADSVKGFDRFFINMGESVKRGFDNVVKFFSQSPAKMAFELGQGLGKATRVVVDFVTSLPGRFTNMEHLLVQKGKDLLVGMLHGIEDGAKAVWNWGIALPGRVMRFADSADKWLVQKGKDVLTGMGHGIVDGAKAVWDFLTALPGHVIDFFRDAPSWLLDAGKNILVGLWNGFWGKVGDILNGVKNFISSFISGFMSGFAMSSPSQVMHNIGMNIISGLWNGVTQMWGTFWGWVTQIPGWIIGFFAGAPSWLVSAGYNICVGIYNGIVSGWSMLTNMVSNLAHSLISAAKGALGISSPSKAAADEVGAWFGPGLAEGITANSSKAVSAAAKLARDVTKAAQSGTSGGLDLNLSTGGFGALGAASGGISVSSGAAGGTGGATINLNVAGHVWTTQDLMKELQTTLLRHGIRNNNPGINYTYA